MPIQNALAGVAVRDLDTSAAWYAALLGTSGHRPMPEVCEWQFARGGALQVFQDAERAGKSSVTLAVADLEHELAALGHLGIPVTRTSSTAAVKTAIIHDPDHNQIVLAQATSPELAK